MADASALAGLLDRAGKVFGLARSLAWDLEQDFKSQGPVVMAGVQPAWQQHGERIKEFVEATLGVRDIVQNPPDGLGDVVKQLCEAGRLAKRLTPRAYDSETNYHFGVLDLWPELNSVAQYGYEAVKAARKATRLDDPFAVFDEPKPTEPTQAVEVTATVPTLDEIRAKVQSTRERTRHPNASNNPNRMAADAYNDFASIVRMLDERGIPAPALPDHRLHPLQTMNYVLQKLDDVEILLNRAAAANGPVSSSSKPAEADENISPRLPRTADEADLLKPAIAELLRKIPASWAEFDFDKLTAVQSSALFLLTAAGMVERRGRIRSNIANHPTCFELRFQATGEAGFARAMEAASVIEFEVWGDAWRTWTNGEKGGRCPFHAEEISPQEWRLTDQGTLALRELEVANADANPATVFDFVLKRGFFGPGYWVRKQLGGQPFTDDDRRTIEEAKKNGIDPALLTRPPVCGEGRLVEHRRIDKPRDAQPVSVANWHEGADVLASAFVAMLGPTFERMTTKTESNHAGDQPTPAKAETAGDDQAAVTGFLGGAALSDALGVHATRRDAFFRQLERQRISLGDHIWHEVRDPRPNSPRYLYRADSLKLRELAAGYQQPKTA